MGVTGGSKLATWKMSGFARKLPSNSAHLRSAPALESNIGHTGGRHKKTVSFSKQQPEERTIAVGEADIEGVPVNSVDSDSAAVSGLAEQMANQVVRDPEEGPLSSSVFQRDTPPLDPMVEKLLEREFGKPVEGEVVGEDDIGTNQHEPRGEPAKFTSKEGYEGDEKRHRQQQDLLLARNNSKANPLNSPVNNEPLIEEKGDLEHYAFLEDHVRSLKPASIGKGGRFSKLFSTKLFGKRASSSTSEGKPSHSSIVTLPDQQLVRVYAGNFTSLHGYKTLLVEESCSMAEVAEQACEKFTLVSDGHDYVLSVVHFDSHEILPVAATTTLASVVEMAKRATIMEGGFAPETSRS